MSRHDRREKRGGGGGGKRDARAFHDRVAGKYDGIYEGSAYWDIYADLSWEGVKPYIPRDLRAKTADLGCGTGQYGLKLLKSGYHVTFLDISQKMLDQAQARAEALGPRVSGLTRFVRADLADMGALESGQFSLVVAQGDPICHAGAGAERAIRECARILSPGGVLVASVDNALGAIDHFLDSKDVDGLERFLRDGMTEWLAHADAERFPLRMFRPDELRKLFAEAGLDVIDLFGKPVLPLRAHEALLEDGATRETLEKIEKRLCREEAMLGRAAHLQVAARKTAG